MKSNHRSRTSSVALDAVAEDELARITALLAEQYGIKAQRSGVVRYAIGVLLPQLQRIAAEKDTSDLAASRFRGTVRQIACAHKTRTLREQTTGTFLERIAQQGNHIAQRMVKEQRVRSAKAAAEEAFSHAA